MLIFLKNIQYFFINDVFKHVVILCYIMQLYSTPVDIFRLILLEKPINHAICN